MEIPHLIAEGASLKARIKCDSGRLKEIEAALIDALASGKHEGADGASCRIIRPSPAVKPEKDGIEAVSEMIDEADFKKLFIREVTFKPVEAFRQVAKAILKAPVLRKVLAKCEKDSAPYVKWN